MAATNGQGGAKLAGPSSTACLASACLGPIAFLSAAADPPQPVVQNDVRLRYEQVDTDAGRGQGLTLRLRPSVEFNPSQSLSILAELDLIVAGIPDDRNGLFAGGDRPAIPDPEGAEVNRLQIELSPSENWSVTAGRQRVSIGNERFIGISDFRQNQQTYDGVTTALRSDSGATLNAGYIWQANRFIGNRQPGGTLRSDSHFLDAGLPTPFGQIGVVHVDLDLDTDAPALSDSRTTALTINGRAFARDLGVFWSAAYAVQDRDGRQPTYAELGAHLEYRDVSLRLRAERLGSDDGVALQTPLATLHKFNGRADVFTVTPPEGLEDLEIMARWRLGSIGPLRGTQVSVSHNDFEPAGDGPAYGSEWGAAASTRLGPVSLGVEWAGYRADSFSEDVDKVWLTLSRRF